MKKAVLLFLVAVLLLAAVTPSFAQPAADRDQVRLRVFIHYPRHGKPQPQPGVCDPSTKDQVRDYLLTGWKHSGTVVYHVNYSSIPKTVRNAQTAITNSFQVWEGQTDGNVHFMESAPTFIKTAKNDGVHVVAWGRIPSANAIAVTYTWYYPTGQVVDQDVIMNAGLPWSYATLANPDQVCGDLYSYDAQNILTHEIGHCVGLDDLYEEADDDLTMYGYGGKGELKKDTLGQGDLLGIVAVYK